MENYIAALTATTMLLSYTTKNKPESVNQTTSQSNPLKNIQTNATSPNDQIKNIFFSMLQWADSNPQINTIPAKLNVDSLYTAIDFKTVNHNVQLLVDSRFFTPHFIENYKAIFTTLNKALEKDESLYWQQGELPSFTFMGEVNPWTLIQDQPFGGTNPYIHFEIVAFNAASGIGKWKWNTTTETHNKWSDFTYSFKVKQHGNTYAIDYLEGFDLKNIL